MHKSDCMGVCEVCVCKSVWYPVVCVCVCACGEMFHNDKYLCVRPPGEQMGYEPANETRRKSGVSVCVCQSCICTHTHP